MKTAWIVHQPLYSPFLAYTKLIGYDFDIQYRPGKENIVAHALSKQFSFSAISLVQEKEEWADWEEERVLRGEGEK